MSYHPHLDEFVLVEGGLAGAGVSVDSFDGFEDVPEPGQDLISQGYSLLKYPADSASGSIRLDEFGE
jgi:hypothetical protein